MYLCVEVWEHLSTFVLGVQIQASGLKQGSFGDVLSQVSLETMLPAGKSFGLGGN